MKELPSEAGFQKKSTNRVMKNEVKNKVRLKVEQHLYSARMNDAQHSLFNVRPLWKPVTGYNARSISSSSDPGSPRQARPEQDPLVLRLHLPLRDGVRRRGKERRVQSPA